MVNARIKQRDVGLFMLGTSSAAGWFALFNPSFFDIIQKGVSAEQPSADDLAAINMSMNLGLGATLVNGAAIWLANGDEGIVPGAASGVAGIILYLLYNYMLHEAINPGVPAWAPEPKPPLPEKAQDIVHEVERRVHDAVAHWGERIAI